MTVYTAKELANSLQIGGSTLRTWATYFNIPREKKGQKWVYYEEAKAIFETIKNMREEDCGLNTIEKKIVDISSKEPDDDLDPVELIHTQKHLASQLKQHNQISEKFARVSFLAGKQQEKTRVLEERNEDLLLHIREQESVIISLKNQLTQSVSIKEHNQLKFQYEELEQTKEKLESSLAEVRLMEQRRIKQLRVLQGRMEQMQQIRVQLIKTEAIKEKIESMEPITIQQVNQILERSSKHFPVQLKLLKPIKNLFMKRMNIKGVSQ